MAWGRRRRRWRRRRPFYRRWGRPIRRRRWRRRKPYRLAARRLRPAFRGYRRRYRVRRRRFRKRQYKGVVTQWNPQHRVGCVIRGWDIAVLAIGGHFGEKSELLWQSKDKPDTYITCGGGVSFKHFSLGILYQQHLLFRNRWSRSNQGFDLARYFGTKLRFYPHEEIDYIVYWDVSFEIPEKDEMQMLHPGILLNNKHKLVVHSLKRRGRRKKLWIKPPPVHTNQWFFQKTWCNTPLFKIGIVPTNFKQPFLHRANRYGEWIGYTSDTEPPQTITWTKQDIEGSWKCPEYPCPANSPGPENTTPDCADNKILVQDQWARRVYYRWWWDDAVDNYVMMNPYNLDPKSSGLNQCIIVKVNVPYWQFFFGLSKLTSKKSPLCVSGYNPSIYALTWYKDTECDVLKDSNKNKSIFPVPVDQNPHPDQDLCGPEQIPQFGKRKFWVLLADCWPWAREAYHVLKDYNFPNYDTVRTKCSNITLSGPFAVTYPDIADTNNRSLNIGFTYASFWQWGGYLPRPDTTKDPCTVGGENPPFPDKKRGTVQVDDPGDTKKLTIHPWDLVQNSIYTKQCFKRLLSDVYPQLLTDHRESPVRDGEQKPKWRKIEEGPSPGESSSSSEESSRESSWSEGEEDPTPTTATAVEQRQQRKRKLRQRQHPSQRKLRRRLDRFLNERRDSNC
nr:MAG: ORF1 [Anelloviridae sp.]